MTDTTIVIQAGTDLDELLERVALASGHSKLDVALVGLEEWLEEQDEAREILSRSARDEPTYTLDEVRRHLGLDR